MNAMDGVQAARLVNTILFVLAGLLMTVCTWRFSLPRAFDKWGALVEVSIWRIFVAYCCGGMFGYSGFVTLLNYQAAYPATPLIIGIAFILGILNVALIGWLHDSIARPFWRPLIARILRKPPAVTPDE